MRLITILAFAAVAGCSSDVGGDTLSGTWGGELFAMSANGDGATITLGCGENVRVAHAIRLDRDGAFSIVDSLRGRGNRDTLPELSRRHATDDVAIDGRITGDVLVLRLNVNPTRPGQGFVISTDGRRGVPGLTGTTGQVCRS